MMDPVDVDAMHLIRRVLVFPPFASYNRLLIHKVVDTHYPDLITFSVGEQILRRTVVSFVEACHRGDKGIQLLSQPKESRTKPSYSSIKWRNLSTQDRVANWVKLREIKNRKREIWNSPKIFNVSDLERDDIDMSVDNLNGEDEMDKSKPKKQAAAVYVPPFLRPKKGTEEFQENVNNSQSYTEGLNPSVTEQNSGLLEAGIRDEPKRPRGRGRGRRKPELQVYVPKPLRESKQEPDREVAGTCLSQQEVKGSTLDDTQESIEESKNIFDDYEEDVKKEVVLHDSDNIDRALDPERCDAALEQSDSAEDNTKLPVAAESLPAKVDGNVQNPLSIDCSGVASDQTCDSSLTFEFYDPAVIAFMPSPKLPQVDDPNESNIHFGNPFHSDCQDNQPQQTYSKMSDFNNVEVDDKVDVNNSNQLVSVSDVSLPVQEDMGETKMSHDASEEPKQETCVNILCNDVSQVNPKDSTEKTSDNVSPNNLKDFTEKTCDDAVSSKKKTKSETKKKKKRDDKGDSSTSEQTNVKKTKSKSKTKSRKSLPEEETKERSPAEKQSQSQRKSVEREPQEEDDGDSWDALFDDDGDCLDGSVLAEITAHVGKVEIDRPKIDYLSYTPKEPDVNYEVFNHIVEIYDFPPEFGTHDIIGAFKDFLSQGFDIKWVDDTHALGVFSSVIAAREALKVFHPMLKTRPMCDASRQGLSKAKSCQEFLQPYKERPQTTSMAARRLVAGALGVAPKMSKEMREQERNKLKAAKEKRKQEKQQKVDIWDGNFGKCAMDDV